VIDVALGPLTVAMHGFEAVAGGVLEERRVVIVGVVRTRAGGAVIGKAGVDTSPTETIDLGRGRRDERDMDAPSDRMVLVGLREREVAPGRQARRARSLLDPKLIEHSREGTAGDS
jgi:hypothetical protein